MRQARRTTAAVAVVALLAGCDGGPETQPEPDTTASAAPDDTDASESPEAVDLPDTPVGDQLGWVLDTLADAPPTAEAMR